MSFIPTVTCRRCGRQYSGVHRRCPNCGTRRAQQSGRVPAGTPSTVGGTAANARAATNAKWQMIFGLLLVAAIIIAVIVLVSASIGERQTAAVTPTVNPSTQITPSPTPTPTPTATPTVGNIKICYYNDERTEFAVKVGGTPTPMTAVVYPLDVQADVKWSTDKEDIISLEVSDDGTCKVSGLAAGSAKLIAECYGVKAECTVYVNN